MSIITHIKTFIKYDNVSTLEKEEIVSGIEYFLKSFGDYRVIRKVEDDLVSFEIPELHLKTIHRIAATDKKCLFENLKVNLHDPNNEFCDGNSKFIFDSTPEEFKEIFGLDVFNKLVELVEKLKSY